MSNKIVIDSGEFRVVLKNLPKALATEASGLVVAHAEVAGGQIGAHYSQVQKSGNLRRGLKVTKAPSGPYGASAQVKSTAPHAWLYEHGTNGKDRHWLTGSKKSVGPMPGANVFIPTVMRERKAMEADLVAMVERAGFTVRRG